MSFTTAVIATQTPRGQWLSKAPGFAAELTGSTTPNDSSQPVIAVERALGDRETGVLTADRDGKRYRNDRMGGTVFLSGWYHEIGAR